MTIIYTYGQSFFNKNSQIQNLHENSQSIALLYNHNHEGIMFVLSQDARQQRPSQDSMELDMKVDNTPRDTS